MGPAREAISKLQEPRSTITPAAPPWAHSAAEAYNIILQLEPTTPQLLLVNKTLRNTIMHRVRAECYPRDSCQFEAIVEAIAGTCAGHKHSLREVVLLAYHKDPVNKRYGFHIRFSRGLECS